MKGNWQRLPVSGPDVVVQLLVSILGSWYTGAGGEKMGTPDSGLTQAVKIANIIIHI